MTNIRTASKCYRPDSVSVSHYNTKDATPETLKNWWKNGENYKTDVGNLPDQLALRKAICDGNCILRRRSDAAIY